MKGIVSRIKKMALLICLTLYSCTSMSDMLSASQILDKLQREDPVNVVRGLHKSQDGREWHHAIAQIQTGNPDWLKVALALESGVGAKGAESLLDAVTRAIPQNPSGVLHILSEQNVFLNIENICRLPLIPRDSNADRQLAHDALASIQAQPQGVACSDLMQKAISRQHIIS